MVHNSRFVSVSISAIGIFYVYDIFVIFLTEKQEGFRYTMVELLVQFGLNSLLVKFQIKAGDSF